jgi:hypothetical protein
VRWEIHFEWPNQNHLDRLQIHHQEEWYHHTWTRRYFLLKKMLVLSASFVIKRADKATNWMSKEVAINFEQSKLRLVESMTSSHDSALVYQSQDDAFDLCMMFVMQKSITTTSPTTPPSTTITTNYAAINNNNN